MSAVRSRESRLRICRLGMGWQKSLAATHFTKLSVEHLEERLALATDFGDAPDAESGVGPLEYRTTLADNGPRHEIVAGLFIGAAVDGEEDGFAHFQTLGDDLGGTDDEDGVFDPSDLRITFGTQPLVRLRVTNKTDGPATLAGWIDYNQDGAFDNAAERAKAIVEAGTDNQIVPLSFPEVPDTNIGHTYARFRIGSDAAVLEPGGAASDGEVEDHLVSIFAPSTRDVAGSNKIADGTGGFGALTDGAQFGLTVANIGDLDGDGVTDMAVGATNDSWGGIGPDSERDAVFILFMNADGSVRNSRMVEETGSSGVLDRPHFGSSVAGIGDLNRDGIPDVAVGARNDGDRSEGAVYILFMNTDGSVQSQQRIGDNDGGLGEIRTFDAFGSAVAAIGDTNADGVTDLAVGAESDFASVTALAA